MEDWDSYRFFLAVVREGSISGAAETLAVNHTTVSRRISALETQLDVRLFDRRRTGFVPTSEGAQLIAAAEVLEAGAKRISRLSLAQDTRLEGALKVSAPLVLVHYVLAPLVSKFASRYPDIDISLFGSDDISNLVNREADIAIRVTASPMDTLIGHKLADSFSGLYASPSYLEANGLTAENALERRDLNWVVQNEEVSRTSWHNSIFPDGKASCRTNNKVTAISAALQGMGVIEMPTMIGDSEPRLTRLAGYEEKSAKSIWVLYHRDLRHTARVRAFVDLLRSDPFGA